MKISFLCLLCVGVFVGCGKMSESQLKAQLDALRKEGMPASLADLDRWYASPPVQENAAVCLEDAFAHLVEERNSPVLPLVGKGEWPALGMPLTPQLKAAVQQHLAKNQKALEGVHKAAGYSKSRYSVDMKRGVDTPLPHLGKLRYCSRLFELETVVHAQNGQGPLALKSVLAILGLAQSLENEPMLISQLVRFACIAGAKNSVERILNSHSLTDEDLRQLQDAFSAVNENDGFEKALVGERCFVLHTLQLPPAERTKIFDRFASQEPGFKEYSAKSNSAAEQIFLLDLMQRYLNAARLPFPESIEAADRVHMQAKKAKDQGYYWSSHTIDSYRKSAFQNARTAAILRATQAVLALERYRLANGSKLPDSLQQLTPGFLASAPIDPFDGQPLRYDRSKAMGYTVYSVGADRQDNQGALKGRAPSSSEGSDTVFTMKR